MPNGPLNDVKKLLNNGRIRARWASLATRFHVAEKIAGQLEVEELIRLCEADKQAARALKACEAEYRSVFRKAEERILKQLRDND